jgi:hypothetical protein
MAIDVTKSGLLKRYRNPEDMPAHLSCALDIAEAGGASATEIGLAVGVSKQRVEQWEASAVKAASMTVLQEYMP